MTTPQTPSGGTAIPPDVPDRTQDRAMRQGFVAAAASGALVLLVGAPVFILAASPDWEGGLYLGIALLTLALCPIPSSLIYLLIAGAGGALAGRHWAGKLLASSPAAAPDQVLRQARWLGALIGMVFGILPFVFF